MGTGGGQPLFEARPDASHWVLIGAVTAAAVVKARFGWIPIWYLALAVTAPAGAAWIVRQHQLRPLGRWVSACVAATVTVALCPVPWMVAAGDGAPGNAWRLDGRVTIDGHTLDPSGEWYWLTVGRPPTIAEVLWSKVGGAASDAPMTMRSGPLRDRPRWSEPAAAAVGLVRGGWPVETRIEGPIVLATLDGRPIDVVVGGWLARTPVGKWYRNLSSGSSHGLMVALVAYTYASGEQLAGGFAVAGTGSIDSTGEVGRVRGLLAKATAARGVDADVLLYPASQAGELDGFDPHGMRLVGVETIDDAISALRAEAIEASSRSLS